MPKQIYKIDQFHGGLNNNSDPRDIADNELSEATDVMVDSLGKIRLMGGTTAHAATSNPTVVINPGYGLFYFSHDRLEGNDAGAAAAETGADYLVLADTDTDTQFFIYERSAGETAWGGSPTAVIDLYTGGSGTTGVEPTFYAVDGGLRVSDGNFGANNTNKWYGYVKRYQFGDGVNGVDGLNSGTNGEEYDAWYSGDQAITALPMDSVYGHGGSRSPAIVDPVALRLYATIPSGKKHYRDVLNENVDIEATDKMLQIQVHFMSTTSLIADPDNAGGGEPGLENFCSPGDYIFIGGSSASPSNDGIYTVLKTRNLPGIDMLYVNETDFTIYNDDEIYLVNLSRMEWWDNDFQYLEVAMSTLYDDSEQESQLSVYGTPLAIEDMLSTGNLDLDDIVITPYVYTSASNTFGSTYPRVTGFKIYIRRSGPNGGTGDWYLFMQISIKEGAKIPEISDEYSMWYSALTSNDAWVSSWANGATTEDYHSFPSISTFLSESLVSDANEEINVDGYKTAVVANRMVYIGNIKQGGVVYGDKMIKSPVNKFDTFPESRTIEASVRDGDEIVKLEEYADRILQFKKNKMHLINISQEIEFLEDTFMHKGVSHPAATCKTDFGIAWVNKHGCYLYDGQNVVNLLEKDGMQIIKESDWESFTTDYSAIGYIPKKRQLLIIDSVNSEYSSGNRYLYDMVTQSWVKSEKTNIIQNPSFELEGGSPFLNWTESLGTFSTYDTFVDDTGIHKRGCEAFDNINDGGLPLLDNGTHICSTTATSGTGDDTLIVDVEVTTKRVAGITVNSGNRGDGYDDNDSIRCEVPAGPSTVTVTFDVDGLGGAYSTDGTYSDCATTKTEGAGDDNLLVDVTVASGEITDVVVGSASGTGYALNDTITISGLVAAGFESWANDDGTFDVASVGTAPEWTKGGTYKHDGTYSAKWEASSDQITSGNIISDTFNLTPSKTYTLSWWGRFSIDPEPTIRLYNTNDSHYLQSDMSFSDLSSFPQWSLFGDADTINTWHYYSLTFIVPSSYDATDGWNLGFYPTTTDDCDTWIDEVSLIEEGNANMTNIVADWNGDLIYAAAPGTMLKWDDTSDGTNSLSLNTKDIDFGQPGVRKKIYKVYITYKGTSDTNVDVFFDVDGGTALDKTFQNGTNFSSNQLAASATWAVAELKPTTSSETNNKKSFRLKFVSNGASASDFEINDISIVYRLKGIK
jgi:hypothetical protein